MIIGTADQGIVPFENNFCRVLFVSRFHGCPVVYQRITVTIGIKGIYFSTIPNLDLVGADLHLFGIRKFKGAVFEQNCLAFGIAIAIAVAKGALFYAFEFGNISTHKEY